MSKHQHAKPILCTTSVMSDTSGISGDTLRKMTLENIFRREIHWCKMPNSERILWNHDLVIDAIIHGSDSSKHQMAIEKFKSSMPSSDDYQPKTLG